MKPFWVKTNGNDRLAIVLRPRGNDWLEDELVAMRGAGVDVLVSLLTRDEELELGLKDEAEVCGRVGLKFKRFPIIDRGTPESFGAFLGFVRELNGELGLGRSVAAHCRASIGRSSLVMAALLSARMQTVSDTFEKIAEARGVPVPDTREQVFWVERFAEYAREQK